MIKVEMTSLEIADMTGKRHSHVLRDIRTKLLPEITEPNFGLSESTYKDTTGRELSMFILNKWSVNALMANYSIKHAIKVIEHIIKLESQVESLKSVVWEVINGQAWVGQEQALKCAGITHPRLFMKYLKSNESFYSSVLERGYIQDRQCSKHSDVRFTKFSQEGFQWLLDNKKYANAWVERVKEARKQQEMLL